MLLTASLAHGQSPEDKFGSSPDRFLFDVGANVRPPRLRANTNWGCLDEKTVPLVYFARVCSALHVGYASHCSIDAR